MEQIILPNVTESAENDATSRFTISPLFPGYGHTVGNGLRRVLLSSLPGAAVTSVKIDGVSHEFSTIPGVKEDAVEVILNLKSLRVMMHDIDEPVVLTLSAKGPGTVTAKDFAANSKVTIANPELHIATLNSGSKFNLEVTVEYGRGYDPIEKREAKSQTLGLIAVDSLFTPVLSVSTHVENTRVGKMTNYDELTMTITTDKSITPGEALKQASAILVDQFNLLAHFDQVQPQAEAETTEAAPQAQAHDEELVNAGISPRIAKILVENGYATVASLQSATDDELKKVSGLGPKALTEIAQLRA